MWRNQVFAQGSEDVTSWQRASECSIMIWTLLLCSGFPRRRVETIKSLAPHVLGVFVGIIVGITFMKFANPPSLIDSSGAFERYNVEDFCPPRAPKDSEDAVNCSSLPPRGSEHLPRGIVVPLTDLYPRRLWGKPEEDLLIKPKYLLTLTVGIKQKDFVNECVQKFSKDWQIVLFHYDGKVSEWDEFEWAKYAIRISTPKQAKWWYAKRFLHPDVVEAYDYIFIWDEDLDLQHFDAEKYMELVKKYGLEISQPGLEPDRGLTWEMTKRLGNSDVHKNTTEKAGWCSDPQLPPCAGFVEIMAPVFSRSAWRCVWHMIQNDLIHGWGLDMELKRCALPAHDKIGVVDAQWIRHRVVLSLNSSGAEDPALPKWTSVTSVRDRCRYEWEEFKKRLKLADEEEKARLSRAGV
nr:uncharacterized protein LOC112289890 isoform X2 [Physcomitrium patens]|eukprot:XP_024391366.1 uncharacterized protein LOC112289890 isoform X2 [Physcomitrella patens]